MMDIEEIKQIAARGESSQLEFKKSTAKLKSAMQTLCGFLNGEGGMVLFGISDDGQLIGQHVTDQTQLEIANSIRKFEPVANIVINYVPYQEDKHIIMLQAHPDDRCIPYCFDGRAYERNSSATSNMPQNRYQQLLLNRSTSPLLWESLPAQGANIADLDEKEIRQMVSEGIENRHLNAALSTMSVSDILARFNLMKDGTLTNAAVVLFFTSDGDQSILHYPQCILKMARFKGIEKSNFIDNKQIFGNAFYLLREAEAFIKRHTAVSGQVRDGEMQRKDEPEYPFKATREALVNALCHRDYASPGSSITLTIFDDRLEIINSGLLPEGITVEQLSKTHTSHPRNPAIVNVFFRRGLIESLGIGTQEILESCKQAGMRKPEFVEQAGTFIVKFWSRLYKSQFIYTDVTERQQAILSLLQVEALAPNVLLTRLGSDITDRTLRRDLQSLKEKGYIETDGETRQATWFILE